MWPYFKSETDAVQNLIDDFFSTLTVRRLFHRKDFRREKHVGTGLISEKPEAMHVELKERVEAATSSYSAEVDFLQYIYQVLVDKNL